VAHRRFKLPPEAHFLSAFLLVSNMLGSALLNIYGDMVSLQSSYWYVTANYQKEVEVIGKERAEQELTMVYGQPEAQAQVHVSLQMYSIHRRPQRG